MFPEYSVPRSMEDKLLRLADTHKIVIIGGFEGYWKDGMLCNEVVIAIPGETTIHFQGKQKPSLDEERDDAFYKDGLLKLFCNSPIGTFSVIVCSDFMELSTLQVWKPDAPLPELLLVVSRNTHYDLFQKFAVTDAVRLYAGVAIANVNDADKKKERSQF